MKNWKLCIQMYELKVSIITDLSFIFLQNTIMHRNPIYGWSSFE